MKLNSKEALISIFFLKILIILLSIGGISGGISLIISPDGSLLQMPVTVLKKSPFTDFLIPGCILFVFIGVLPAILAYSLIWMPKWRFPEILNIYKKMYWCWTYTLYSGIILIIWMDVEIAMIGYGSIIQLLYLFYGLAVIITSLLPPVIKYYKIENYK